MTTDWLNPAQAKADRARLEAEPCCDSCVAQWHATAGKRVLEAIAALPNPTTQDNAWNFEQIYSIWLCARIITGKG